MGWFMTHRAYQTNTRLVKDWIKFPELRLLDRFFLFVPALLAMSTFAFGWYLERHYPSLGTSGWQMMVWAFLISTVCLYHTTYCVNSVAHTFGTRRFKTNDDSRNNWLVALLTCGEGWHNNHHYYPASARQGFYWWEIDLTYYALVILSYFRIVWDLKPVPAAVLEQGRKPRQRLGRETSL
jgi:stearoyl-CoA desaturase (delta-9 desaturase)